LQAVGISISKREVMRLLIDRQDDFLGENRDVLRVGLETAPWSVRNFVCERALHMIRPLP
jgi:hypothetical protein